MASKKYHDRDKRAEEMFSLMKVYLQSGQTQQSFREKHDIARSTFQYWLRRYRQLEQADRTSSRTGFVPLEVAPRVLGASGIVITYNDGTRVELPVQIEASFIRQLLGR